MQINTRTKLIKLTTNEATRLREASYIMEHLRGIASTLGCVTANQGDDIDRAVGTLQKMADQFGPAAKE